MPASEEAAGQFFVDLAFMSTKGFQPTDGTFESSLSTIQIKRIIAQQCAKMMLLVDHSKFGQRALSKVLDLSQIGEVITDDHARNEIFRPCGKEGLCRSRRYDHVGQRLESRRNAT